MAEHGENLRARVHLMYPATLQFLDAGTRNVMAAC